jgi:hypothetical protein
MNAVHQRDSQEYLKSKTVEQMKERRKKEIIVERYEAKLKEEAEMLAYQAQRDSESRQRSHGQRSRNPRGSGVCCSRSFPPNQPHYTHRQSSARRSNPPANRRSSYDEEAPMPSRANVGSSRQHRPQDYDGERQRVASVSMSGRRPTLSEDEDEQQAVYSRRPVSSSASKSRGMVVGNESPEFEEEYDVQPVSRRGARGSTVEYGAGVGGGRPSSSSFSRSRRAQA